MVEHDQLQVLEQDRDTDDDMHQNKEEFKASVGRLRRLLRAFFSNEQFPDAENFVDTICEVFNDFYNEEPF